MFSKRKEEEENIPKSAPFHFSFRAASEFDVGLRLKLGQDYVEMSEVAVVKVRIRGNG